MSREAFTAHAGGKVGFVERMLAGIERAGNKVPDPAILFMVLILGVVLLSQALDWANVSVVSTVADPETSLAITQGTDTGGYSLADGRSDKTHLEEETVSVKGLLTIEGVRFMFTSFVPNFLGFAAVGVILVAMIGVGIAELSGLIGALIRRLVAISSEGLVVYIIVFVGILSSVAADAGYLVLIPLAATAFASIGKHPLAGIAAGFAAVSAAFGINVLITPADAVNTDIANEASALVSNAATIDVTANLFFGIGSTILLTIVIALITTKIIEPRLGEWKREDAEAGQLEREEGPDIDPKLEQKGLRHSGYALLGVLVVVLALTLPHGAPLRNPETGDIIGDSPLMTSLIVIISAAFLAAGLAFGRAVGTIKTSKDALGMITKSWATLASLLFLFLLIAQFIAYFDYSNIARVIAISLGDALESMNLSDILLLFGVIVVTTIVNFLIPAKIAKWAILAPIFVPLMLRLGVSPQSVLAAYRVGDSPTNVLTPLMPYFPLMVVFAAKYQKDSGIGTVIALMIPYALVIAVIWTIFFLAWYALGIPLGPGWPV